MKLDKKLLLRMYHQMLRIRYFEERVDELFSRGLIHGTCHLYIGEEAIAVGAVSALHPEDYIISTHRGHGHCLMKGAESGKMMAEILGKKTGYCKGKGGSMHIADLTGRNLGANGIVGGGIPLAVGAAFALKYRKKKEIILCFFGDGAVNQGCFHESLNMSGLLKLPVVFICENNKYGMSMNIARACASETICQRAYSYAMEGIQVDGNDVLSVYDTVSESVESVRSGGKPVLIEALTYRWKGHSKSDRNLYRTREEIDSWKARCPIKTFHGKLIDELKVASETELLGLEKKAEMEMDEAVQFAMASPEPEVEEAVTDVYA